MVLLVYYFNLGLGGFHRIHKPDGMSKEEYLFWWMMPFVLAFAGFIYLVIRHKRKYRYWTDGVFPHDLPFTRLNLMMAYLCTAVLLFHCDKALLFKKVGALRLWLRQRFPEIKIDTRDYFGEALEHPVKPESLAVWLGKHLDPAQKEELLLFLLQLAFYDDTVKNREYDLLAYFAHSFKMSEGWLDTEISREQKARYERESRHRSEYVRETAVSKKAKAFETLGLEVTATIREIKQAYRKLVKLCHPDKFQQESDQVRKEAEARFREIQEAYDYLQASVV